MEFICKFCGKICKNKNSLIQHEIRCKSNPNRINLDHLSHRDYSNFKFNPSNQYIDAKKKGLPTPTMSEETKYKIGCGWRGKTLPEDMKNNISKGMKKAVKNNPQSYNGVNINGKVKKYKYNNVYLDGTWEVTTAKYLDNNNIVWERPKKGIEYIWQNDIHLYYPDFYLPEYDIYLEVKGFKTDRDSEKWKNINNLIIIEREDIKYINKGEYNIFEKLKVL